MTHTPTAAPWHVINQPAGQVPDSTHQQQKNASHQAKDCFPKESSQFLAGSRLPDGCDCWLLVYASTSEQDNRQLFVWSASALLCLSVRLKREKVFFVRGSRFGLFAIFKV